jgi:hypothetical protein
MIRSASISFKCSLDTLPNFDIFHTTIIDLPPLPRSLDDLLDDLPRDADDAVYIGNDVVSRMHCHRGKTICGALRVDLEGDVYRRWSREWKLTQGRMAPRKNGISKGIELSDVPTATRDYDPECFASHCSCGHEPTPDRVFCGYDQKTCQQEGLIPKAGTLNSVERQSQ